jgi:hypothetical protein
MLLVTCLAPCAPEEKRADERSAEKIKTRIEKAVEAWSSESEETRATYDAKIRQILDSLSHNEIRLVAQYIQDIDAEEEAFRRWARFDPAGALQSVRAVEDANAAEIRLAGTGLEGGPGEAVSGWVFGMYLGALDGWSEVEPKAAWESFKKREGPLAKSLVVEDYLHYFYRVLFDHLARVDPDLAFQELIRFRADKYEEMFTASMLAGYLHSAPRGRDWRKEAGRLLERKWKFGDVYAEMRTALMGRWLEDSPRAAEKWFQEGDVEDLHWSYVDPPSGDLDPFASDSDSPHQQQAAKEKRRNDLGGAAGYWAARDFPAAWRWMRAYLAYSREGFGADVLDGTSAFFNEECWGSQTDAREHYLKEVAKLSDQLDRDQFALHFAKVLWVFDDTEFLGEPPPDKAKWLEKVRESITTLRLSPEAASGVMDALRGKPISEQGGAGQPATRSKSDSEGKEKPQPESKAAPR